MKYTKYIEPHGDGIARTLRKLRAQYGDAWTDAMAEYARRLSKLNPHMEVINEGDHVHMEPR